MSNRDIIVKLRLAGEQFDRDFKVKFQDLTDAAEKASADSGTRAGSSFGKNFASSVGVAAGAAGAAIGLAINSAANLGKEIASASKQFNIGVEQLQVWRQAAATAGVSADNLSEGLGTLTEKIGEANAGNKQVQQSFVELGVGFKTASGEARATDAVMLDLAKRIAEIENPAERVRLGQQLLGDEFKNLHPLLLQGAEGFRQAATDLGEFGAMLSREEIQNLQETNAKIEQMKAVLSIKVAGIVAENADSIIGLADAIATLTGSMVEYARRYPEFAGMLGGAAIGARAGGPWGALIGGVGGLAAGAWGGQSARDGVMDPAFRKQQLDQARQRYENPESGRYPWLDSENRRKAKAELDRQQQLYIRSLLPSSVLDFGSGPGSVPAPRITAGGGVPRRVPGGGSPTQSAAEKEAERAAKEALRNEEQLRDAMARTLRAQQDSADVQRIRATQGEEAAARAEAELGFLRQHPLAVNDTVEALAKALGITKELTEADRQRLQLLIDQGNAAQAATGEAAAAKVREDQAREAKRQEDQRAEMAQREADRWAAEYERAIGDVANIYETAFRGGTEELWRGFRDEGLRMIAEVAAQWTIAMISGQKFSLGGALGGAFAASPLSSLFFGIGGGGGAGFGGRRGGAANDNGGAFPDLFGKPWYFDPTMSNNPFAKSGGGWGGAGLRIAAAQQAKAQQALQMKGFSLALGMTAASLAGGGGTASQIGGLIGSIGGEKLGGKLLGKALGSFAGPVGAIVGGLLFSILPSLFRGAPRGSATIGNVGGSLGITGVTGNNKDRKAAATGAGSSLIDAIFNIANQLGGGVDASRGSVSIGMRKDAFVVDPRGRGETKTKKGAISFGSDQEAAIRFAISDLIKDGVITGISQTAQNLLRGGGDISKQVEKALLIGQIPKLLQQRLDPLGAALDELADKFDKVKAALVEGGASAEEFAQARQLWELEKADAIKSVGAAAQTLKDFLASLNAGSNSPLSLREQRAEAEKQLAPYLTQISTAEAARAEVERLKASGADAATIAAAEAKARTSASAIDQQGFANASQLLLSISRQTNASGSVFFSDFDRIRALTGQAIGFVDQATARGADGRDPFGSAIAQNTGDMAAILADHTKLLQGILGAVNDNATGAGGGTFVTENRAYAN